MTTHLFATVPSPVCRSGTRNKMCMRKHENRPTPWGAIVHKKRILMFRPSTHAIDLCEGFFYSYMPVSSQQHDVIGCACTECCRAPIKMHWSKCRSLSLPVSFRRSPHLREAVFATLFSRILRADEERPLGRRRSPLKDPVTATQRTASYQHAFIITHVAHQDNAPWRGPPTKIPQKTLQVQPSTISDFIKY